MRPIISNIYTKEEKNMLTYNITVAGCSRDLPICPLNDSLSIAGFVIFGDVELTCRCAEELNKKIPPHDIMITAESKGIPLIHEMARQQGINDYVLARKGLKLYMVDPVEVKVRSITTAREQTLYIDKFDVEKLKGKRVLVVDDVASTGESMDALEKLVEAAGGDVVGRAAILAEGDAKDMKNLVYLEELPLFTPDGKPIR